jgi:hypothetical protein
LSICGLYWNVFVFYLDDFGEVGWDFPRLTILLLQRWFEMKTKNFTAR